MLKENEQGTLTVACDECDVSSFAKKGTAAANRWRAKLPPDAAPAPEPVPKALAAPAPASVPKAPAQATPALVPEPVPKAPAKRADPFDPMAFFAKGKTA
jgi:hypothetical protein